MIADLEALLVKATPGPWQARFLYRVWCRVRESPGDLFFEEPPVQDWSDCELIAATHNALPAILTALRAAEALRKRLELIPFSHSQNQYHAELWALRSALAALGEGPR